MKVNFTIDGEPAGKGRPRVTKFGTHTPEQTVMYENWIKLLYNTTVKHCFEDNVRIIITCHYSITKKDREALGKGKVSTKAYQEAKAKLDGSIRPQKKPDLDNIIKIIGDALNKIAYKDDAQVVEVIGRKYYSEKPRVEVTIEDI
jgi:Holliday junction resolvase RusA-like endonuclease